MKTQFEWVDGLWWVSLPESWYRQGSVYALGNRQIRGVLWVPYDTLCEAFPGFRDLVTPL